MDPRATGRERQEVRVGKGAPAEVSSHKASEWRAVAWNAALHRVWWAWGHPTP